MNNGNKSTGNSELIAIANRRREELKKAQARQAQVQQPQPKPQPQPQPQSQQRPQPQPRPQPMPEKRRPSPEAEAAEKARARREEAIRRARTEEEKKRAKAIRRARAEEEKRRAETEKRKKEEAARIERDKIAEQKRIERRERADELAERLASVKETYKGTLKNAFGYFAVFICVLLIICTVSATIFLVRLLGYGEKPDTPAAAVFSTEGKKKNYDYSDIVRDGIYYLDFSPIAELCSLSQSGDKDLIIYSTANGEQIRFAPPSRVVMINGNSVTASGAILSESERLLVPLDLVQNYFIGLDVTVDEGVNEETGKPYLNISISRIAEGKGFADISFLLKYNSVLSGISNESLPEEPVTLPVGAPTYEYAADLSYYLRFMCPEDFDKHMILINPSNPKDATYIPEDLISVPNPRYDNGSSLCRDASMSLEALFLEMHTLGFREMKISVAYRSYEQQEYQFDVYTYNERYYYRSHYESEGKWFSDEAYAVLGKAYLEEKYISQGKTSLSADDAKRVAMSYSAYPGTGDHQTGLAFDLYLSGFSGQKFAETEEYKWLLDNAHKFGFIFRYPKEKENITGYSFEPYHLRFVGQYHAAIIHETGLSLEEYVAKYID